MRRLAILLGVLGALLAHSAQSDEIRPGYLELRQTAPDTYSLLFKIPALGDDLRLAIYVNLPEGTNDVTPPRARFSGGAYIERRTIRRNGGLAGQTIAIEGLSAHVHGRAGADRKSRRRHADRTAFADEDDVRRPGRAGRLGSRRDLSAPRDRTHPVRLRSSAVRPGAGDPGSRLAARRPHRDGVHRCAQHHARGGDARLGQRAGPAASRPPSRSASCWSPSRS